MNIEKLRKEIIKKIDSLQTRIFEVSDFIFNNPELGREELKASKLLASELQQHNFDVEMPVVGLKTAFKAVKKGKMPSYSIGYLAEYDALPEIGHGCGHNFIGTASTFAGIALGSVINQLSGSVIVFGTPSEENHGDKITMLEKGAFDELDVAMMIHPSIETKVDSYSLACSGLEVTFIGKSAHASAAPWMGINALDALIQTFVAVNNLKKQLPPTTRVPGIIKYGGSRANVVPDKAVGQFSLRGGTKKELDMVVKKVKDCARGAAIQTGAKVRFNILDKPYLEMNTNKTIAEQYRKNLELLGLKISLVKEKGMGSVDIGNVSHKIPAIHAYMSVTDKIMPGHSREFAQAVVSKLGRERLIMSAKVLALTGLDLLVDKSLIPKAKKELHNWQKEQEK